MLVNRRDGDRLGKKGGAGRKKYERDKKNRRKHDRIKLNKT